MIATLTNYLESFLHAGLPLPLPKAFDFFDPSFINQLPSGARRDGLMYSLRIAKKEVRQNDDAQIYFETTRKMISTEFEKYFIAHSPSQEQMITNNILIQLQLFIESVSQPLLESLEEEIEWPKALINHQKEIITAYVKSYVKLLLNQLQEKLNYLSPDGIEQEMNACLIGLLQDENMQKTSLNDLVAGMLLEKKGSHIAERGHPKHVTLDISKSVNKGLDRHQIDKLKDALEAKGMSPQSVPVFFKLMGYYLGLKKNAEHVTYNKVVYPGDEGYEQKTTAKKHMRFFGKRQHKEPKNDKLVGTKKNRIKF